MAYWRESFLRRKRYQSSRNISTKLSKSRKIVALAKLAFIGVIVLFLGSFVIFPLFAFNLPSPDKIVRKEGYSTKIMDTTRVDIRPHLNLL